MADYLDLQSLYAGVIQYVEDKSQEEISYMVRNEDLKSLLKIVKVFLYTNHICVCVCLSLGLLTQLIICLSTSRLFITWKRLRSSGLLCGPF